MRVCFSAPYAYPLFDAADPSPIGGAETRAWLFARGLLQLGVQVDVLVETAPAFEHRVLDGVRLWNLSDGYDAMRRRVADWWSPPSGRSPVWRPQLIWELPCLAAVKWWRRWRPPPDIDMVLRRIDPDVCCVWGVSHRSAVVVQAAHRQSRATVLFLASNDDLHEQFTITSDYRSPRGESGAECAALIATADVIVTQSAEQQAKLQMRFSRTGTQLPAPFDFRDWRDRLREDSPTLQRLGLKRFVLWVGRADRFHKRPLLALELARRCPEVVFLMVLNPGEAAVTREVRADAPPNLRIVERVPFAEMPSLLGRARALVTTSSPQYEGAPNIFLQAAVSRTPVLSLENVGAAIHGIPVGRDFDGDLDAMSQAVQSVWCDDALHAELAACDLETIEAEHDLDVVSRQLLAILHAACKSTPVQSN